MKQMGPADFYRTPHFMQSQCFKLKDEICKFPPSGSKICGSWLPIPYIYVMKNDN